MTESAQPTSVELRMVVQRACRQPDCPSYMKLDCPHHSREEDMGVVVKSAAQKTESK